MTNKLTSVAVCEHRFVSTTLSEGMAPDDLTLYVIPKPEDSAMQPHAVEWSELRDDDVVLAIRFNPHSAHRSISQLRIIYVTRANTYDKEFDVRYTTLVDFCNLEDSRDRLAGLLGF